MIIQITDLYTIIKEANVFGWYLWVVKAGQVGVKVKLDAFVRPREGHTAHKQHRQHHEGESCRDVDNLVGKCRSMSKKE